MLPLIFIPGLACDAEVWAEVIEALPPPARRGLRISDVHTRHASLPAMAAALLAEASGPAILIGHSMGGMVAMHAALQASQAGGAQAGAAPVAGLALLGTTARPDTPELIALRTQAIELFAAGRLDEVLRANLPFAFHPDSGADEALRQRYLAIVRRAGAEQLIRQNRAVMARADLRPHLAAIACPVLVACGEGDALTPPAVSDELAALLPRAQRVRLAGCGHMLTLEQPAAVASLLAGWLDGLDGRGQPKRARD